MKVEHDGRIPNLEWGNAETVDTAGRHWIVGYSPVLQATPLRFMPKDARAAGVAIKWRAHPPNDPEGTSGEKPPTVGRTVTLLTNEGGQFRLRFWTENKADATVLLLDKPGDFAAYGACLNHEWEAPTASTMVTICWTPEA